MPTIANEMNTLLSHTAPVNGLQAQFGSRAQRLFAPPR